MAEQTNQIREHLKSRLRDLKLLGKISLLIAAPAAALILCESMPLVPVFTAAVLAVACTFDRGRTLKRAWSEIRTAYRDTFHDFTCLFKSPTPSAQHLVHEGNAMPQQSNEPKIGDKMPDDARRVNDRRSQAMTQPTTEPKIGATMPDGTIYAGISPDTGMPMYTTPVDAGLTMTFNQAKEYAAAANGGGHGHKDWRLATIDELNLLFNNRAAIGGFDDCGSNPASSYWSSTPYYETGAWCERFSDGHQIVSFKDNHSSVRLVRSAVSHRQ